jgi:hypothetical protein
VLRVTVAERVAAVGSSRRVAIAGRLGTLGVSAVSTSTQKLYSGGSKHIYTGVFQYRQC